MTRTSVGGTYAHAPAGAEERARLAQQAATVWTRELAALRDHGLAKGMRFLDLGCGPGSVMGPLATDEPPGFCLGVDQNVKFLAHARAHGAVLQADLMHLPVRPDTFDFALLRFVVRHHANCIPMLREARRTLRVGGRLCVIDADDHTLLLDPPPLHWAETHNATMQSFIRRGGSPNVGRRLPALLQAAGLVDVRVTVLAVTTFDLDPPAFVEVFLAPDARPLDPDLLDGRTPQQAWGEVRKWARERSGFGMALGFIVSGRNA